VHVASVWLTFVSGFFDILQGLQELKSRREIANGQTDTEAITQNVPVGRIKMIKFHCGIYFVCNNACVLLIEYMF